MKKGKAFAKRVLALVLSLIMAFSLVSEALAEQVDTIKYVSLVESMTNGYGLNGYLCNPLDLDDTKNGTGEQVNGYLQKAEDAYPSKFATWLAEYTDKTVDLTQLAISCTRAEDLNFLLHFDANDEKQINVASSGWSWDEDIWEATFDYGDRYTWDNFTDGRWNDMERKVGKPGLSGTDRVATKYQDSIAKADVVSMAIGNSNFGVFMLRYVLGALGMPGLGDYGWLNVENAWRTCDAGDDVKQMVAQVVEQVKEKMGATGLSKQQIDNIADIVSYTMISYVINYAQCIDRIVELNPDVELMIMGLFNSMEYVKIELDDGTIFDFGAVVGMCLEAMNTYLASIPAVCQMAGKYEDATFYFTEAKGVEPFTAKYADGEAKNLDVVRLRTIESICNLFGLPEQIVTLDNVKKFDELRTAALNDPEKLGDLGDFVQRLGADEAGYLAMYLGMEELMTEACQLESVKGSSVIELPKTLTEIQACGNPMNAPILAEMKGNIATETKTLLTTNQTYLTIIQAVPGNPGLAQLLATPDAIVNAVVKYVDKPGSQMEDLLNMFDIFAIFMAGDGIGSHPSADGHTTIKDAMAAVYENGTTSQDYLTGKAAKAFAALKAVTEEYATKVGEFAWNYAVNSEALDELDASVARLHELLKDNAYQINGDLMTAVTDASGAVKTQLEALKADLEGQAVILEETGNDTYALTMLVAGQVKDALTAIDAAAAAINVALKDLHAAAIDTADTLSVQLPIIVKGIGSDNETDTGNTLQAFAAIKGSADALKAKVDAADAAVAALDALLVNSTEALRSQLETVYGQVEALHDTYADVFLAKLDEYCDVFAADGETLKTAAMAVASQVNTKLEELKPACHDVYERAVVVGQTAIADAKAYAEEYGLCEKYETAMKVLNTAVGEIEALLEKYPDMPEKAWAYAQKKGYIDTAYNALENLCNNYIDALLDTATGINGDLDTQLAAFRALKDNESLSEQEKAAAAWQQIEGRIAFLQGEMTKVSKIEDCLNAVVASLKNESNKYVVALTNQMEKVSAQLALVNEKALAVNGQIVSQLEAVQAGVAQFNSDLAMQLNAMIEQTQAQIEAAKGNVKDSSELIASLLEKAYQAIKEAQYDATHADYYKHPTGNYYVALGGKTVGGAGLTKGKESPYPSLVANALKIDSKEYSYNELTVINGVGYIKEYAEEIAAADLITYQLDADVMSLTKAMTGDGDMSAYVDADTMALAQKLQTKLEEILDANWKVLAKTKTLEAKAMLKKAVNESISEVCADLDITLDAKYTKALDKQLDKVIDMIIEKLVEVATDLETQKTAALSGVMANKEMVKKYLNRAAYVAVAYAVETVKVSETIRVINPDAEILMVGMYNPLQGVSVKVGEDVINVGELFDYVIAASNIYCTAYAAVSNTVSFVAVPDTAIGLKEQTIDVADMSTIISKVVALAGNDTYATADGHKYIADQIIKALNVTEFALESIEITTAPTKTTYMEGKNFETDGMVVTAKYTDGTSEVITGYTVEDGTALTAGKTSVTISYTEGGVTKTTTQRVTVVAKALDHIAVTQAPTTTEYHVGTGIFNKAGMIVMAYYNDESSAAISGYTVSPDTALTAGTTYVTISYTEGGVTKTTTQSVTVCHSWTATGECSICRAVNLGGNTESEIIKDSNHKNVASGGGTVVKSKDGKEINLAAVIEALKTGTTKIETEQYDIENAVANGDAILLALLSKSDLTTEQKAEIEKLIAAVNTTDTDKKNKTVIAVWDAACVLYDNDGYPVGNLTERSGKVTVKLDIGSELYSQLSNSGKKVMVLRGHTNAAGTATAEELSASLKMEDNRYYVTFDTNKFSTLALVSYTPENPGGSVIHSGGVSGVTTVATTMPMLRKGNTGDAVKTLQTKLNALGYNCGAVDGIFGTKTYNAVIKYQKAMGLVADGIVGKLTWAKLGVTGTVATVAATTSITSVAVASNMPMVRKGNSGDAVKTLQTKLNALGYNCGAVDGIFGTKTYNAVIKYQKAMGLVVDGVVGRLTWGKLN